MFVSKKKYEHEKAHVASLRSQLVEARSELEQMAEMQVERLDENEAFIVKLKQELIKKPLIDSQESLERLMSYMEKHYIDEVTVDGVTIKKSVHLLPEDPEAKKKQQADLVDYAAD